MHSRINPTHITLILEQRACRWCVTYERNILSNCGNTIVHKYMQTYALEYDSMNALNVTRSCVATRTTSDHHATFTSLSDISSIILRFREAPICVSSRTYGTYNVHNVIINPYIQHSIDHATCRRVHFRMKTEYPYLFYFRCYSLYTPGL